MKTALTYCLLLSALLLGSHSTLAQVPQRNAPMWLAQKAGLSPAQAAAQAERQYGGRVLKIRRDGDRYNIKLLQESGHVIHVSIDANGPGGKGGRS